MRCMSVSRRLGTASVILIKGSYRDKKKIASDYIITSVHVSPQCP